MPVFNSVFYEVAAFLLLAAGCGVVALKLDIPLIRNMGWVARVTGRGQRLKHDLIVLDNAMPLGCGMYLS
ncbi:MAG: hypothetical protein OEV99_01430 [Nitrospira sp.]|nr:hypothetical protein [Nitrospira sp.]MDH4368476.1 hypothetical protein [Nitrospira sp.]MDH5496132.1 hypothetical protein [Nitrospira sp.]